MSLDFAFRRHHCVAVHLNDSDLAKLQRNLLGWFRKSSRDLPWRQGYDPYQVWISEIMLQQTQMDRAVAYFTRWMERFPDIKALAAASEDQVLHAWEGLGYYSRARNILCAARKVVREHGGILPGKSIDLLALPGIGPYTAGAIRSIAFNRDEPAVDANVERVLSRLLDVDAPVKTTPAQNVIRQAAHRLIPCGRARDFNQALMELGALVCTPKSPSCGKCPLSFCCEAKRLGITAERPVPGKRTEFTPLSIVAGVLIHKGYIFIQKRPAHLVWGNLWEFPGGRVEANESPERAVVREFMEETEFRVENVEKITVIKHGYTTYRVTLHTFFCSLQSGKNEPVLHAAQEHRWIEPRELDSFPFPAAHRKLIDCMVRDLRFDQRLTTSN